MKLIGLITSGLVAGKMKSCICRSESQADCTVSTLLSILGAGHLISFEVCVFDSGRHVGVSVQGRFSMVDYTLGVLIGLH